MSRRTLELLGQIFWTEKRSWY